MRTFTILAFLAAAASAQTLTVTGPASIAVGKSTVLTVSVSGSSGQNLAALQWTLAPSGLTLGTPTIGAPASAAGKGVFCNPLNGVCLAAGLSNTTPQTDSDNAMTDGAVATIPVTISAPLGPLAIPLSVVLGASTTASPIAIASGAAYSITVTPSPCDYNQDGLINTEDASAIINAIIGTASCSTTFTAGCSLETLQSVILAASSPNPAIACTLQ